MDLKKKYNERLFQGWQSIYHLRRFYWLKKQLEEYGKNNASFIELGCFDAKTLDFIPKVQLGHYLGLDANWEKGLDDAKGRYKDDPRIIFQYCSKPDEVPTNDAKYDFGIALETLEHVRPELMDAFLEKMFFNIDGYIFITVPVERGFSLLVATAIRIINRTWEKYGLLEWLNAFLGRMHKVSRIEHKGFDDRIFINQVSKYFDIEKIEGIFFNTPYANFNLSIGIVAKSKKIFYVRNNR